MNRRDFLKVVGWTAASLAFPGGTNAYGQITGKPTPPKRLRRLEASEDRPNIVLVLCDDLGYGDLSCYGHPQIKTPNLDRFADEGVKLTDCYAAASACSPARVGILTGRTPYRGGVYDWIPANNPMQLKAQEATVAKLLKNSGYATCHVGKWHCCWMK